MMLPIEVIGDRVAVDVSPKTRSDGGLIIPINAKNEAEQGIVISCGPEVKSSSLKAGAHVVFGRFAGTIFKANNRELKIVREEDVMLILNSTEESNGKRYSA
ncbi:MAG: co-chaperone GroES [Patescibacteria group bacterium]|nr:co-chaperone GroES [Patescibacteria group bacterium]